MGGAESGRDRIEAYVASRDAAYVRARTYLVYRVDARLAGLVVWGEPTLRDLEELLDLYAREQRTARDRYASLVDFRRLKTLDHRVFGAWAEHARAHRELQAARMNREAVIRPVDGMLATVLMGYRHVVEPAHPFEVFTSTADALAWLGRDDAAAAVDAMEREADAAPLVARLVDVLARDLGASAADAARALGLSTRALQRGLEDAGTTYRAEVQRVRLDAAKRLLDGGAEIAAVAARVGFANAQSFTKWFTAGVGVTPGAFRARRG